jgi:hypothetical protein
MDTLDPQAVNLAKAMRRAETGGSADPYNQKGASGEFGAYQFMPATYKAYAKKYVGDENAPPTVENQNKIAYSFIVEKKNAGYNPAQIASMWNAGEGKPDAYKENYRGVNAQGVQYDTPAYAAKVSKHYNELRGVAAPTTLSQPIEPVQQDLATGLGEKLAGRVQDISDTFQQPNLARGVLRSAGAVAGGIGDVVGAGLSAITPDFIEKPFTQAVGGVVGGALNTPIGQQAVQGYENIDPEIRKDIEAAGNIATLLPIGKGAQLATQGVKGAIPTAVRAVAKTEGLAGTAAKKALVNEALDIVSPKPTASVLKKGIKSGRGQVGGLSQTVSIAEDAKTLRAAEAAAGTVKKGKTLTENANAVRGEISKTAVKLEDDLKALDVVPIVQREELDGILKKALDDIGENPTMVGNAEKSAERILAKFKSFLPEGDVSAFDLLKARKKLDRWIEGLEGGSKVFDPSYENAKTIALRSIRQGANDLIALKAPGVAVKDMLAKQSALYDALENIAAKAVKEVGTTGAERFGKKHPAITGLLGTGAKVVGTGLGIGSVSNLFSEK